jgi:uncharacterized protein (DUF362 family)
MSGALVAALRTTPETVLQDIDRLCGLADMQGTLRPGVVTILKDNISWHFPMPGANTTPWQLEGTILALRARGYDQLACVQNKTVVTNAFKGQDLNRLRPVLDRYKIPVLYNFRESDMRWIEYRPRGRMLVLDKLFPEGIRIPDYFVGKNIVHLPTMKCHIYTTTTGAMKNAFGGLLNTKRHYTHSWIHETLVDLLTIQKEIHTGIFAVMDGTTAGDGPGPRTLRPVVKNLLLASADQVAIDAVAAKVMGFDPLRIGYIRLAHEQGLGIGDPRDIKIVGDDISSESWGFEVGNNLVGRVGRTCWFGPLQWAQKLLFRTPLVWLFVLASECYHDWYRWPARDRRVFREWACTSRWGSLWRTYWENGLAVSPGYSGTDHP